MKTSFTEEERRALRPRLVYSRWLYEKGAREADGRHELNQLVAITFFFAAIESIIQNILLAHNLGSIKSLRTQSFINMIDAIDKKGSGTETPPLLPLRSEILSVAEARNEIIHHGRRFHHSETERARSVCKRFLREAAQSFLFEDIETISMIDLLADGEEKRVLAAAEAARRSGELTNAGALAKYVVETVLAAANFGFWPDIAKHERKLAQLAEILERQQKLPARMVDVFETLGNFMEATRERESWLLLAILGVDAASALRFYSLPVEISTAYVRVDRQLRISAYKHQTLADDDAEFAIQFAVDVCLRVADTRNSEPGVPTTTRMSEWTQSFVDLPPALVSVAADDDLP